MSSPFGKRDRVNTRIELSKYSDKYYLNCGLRRVYTTDWARKWQTFEQDHGAIDRHGSYLTCYRPRVNGKQYREYRDMSMADIDISQLDIQPFDPVNTKYMTKHYLGGVSLKDVAHMPTNDFLRHIESIGSKRTNPYNRRKRRLGPIPKKSVTNLETK